MNNISTYISHHDRHRNVSNGTRLILNNLDTEDLIIFTNLLARSGDLATATEGFDR